MGLVFDANSIMGLVFVTLFAYTRFNTPRINRNATTFTRYLGVQLTYLITNGLLYWILAAMLAFVGPSVLIPFLDALGIKSAGNLPASLLSALLLTVLLPRLPGLGVLDEQVRDWFQRMASVSQIAANLSNLLQYGTLNIAAKSRTEIELALEKQGIKRADIRFDDDDSPQYIWTKTSVMVHRLRNWRLDPSYERFVTRYADECKALLDEYAKLLDNACHCFRLADAGLNDPILAEALKDCRNHHAGELKRYLTKLCDLMSRGIIQTRSTPEARRAAVNALGFEGEFSIGFTIHQVAFVFLTLLVIFLAGFVVAGHTTPAAGGSAFSTGINFILLPLQIATSYTVAVLCAILIRNRYRLTHHDVAQRPWALYAGTALLAAATGSVIAIVFGALRPDLTLQQSIERYLDYRWAFQLMPMAMAFTTAYLIDKRPANTSRRQARLREGALAAGVMAFVASIVINILGELNPQGWGWTLQDIDTLVKIVRYILISTVLGFFIGYWVPTTCRESSETIPRPEPLAPSGHPSTP